jgi:hypothetical protein
MNGTERLTYGLRRFHATELDAPSCSQSLGSPYGVATELRKSIARCPARTNGGNDDDCIAVSKWNSCHLGTVTHKIDIYQLHMSV